MPKIDHDTEQAYVPKLHEPVIDSVRNKIGEFMGKQGPSYMLRPLGGGREWEAEPGNVRPLTQDERLKAQLRARNSRSPR
jgi:hypothetical protein